MVSFPPFTFNDTEPLFPPLQDTFALTAFETS